MIYCPAGHLVCDSCHGAAAMDVGAPRAGDDDLVQPRCQFWSSFVAHPGLPMHGPEHHPIVAGVIVAAARNTGAVVPDRALRARPRARRERCQGGWCGYYGACGAAIGVGIAGERPDRARHP